MMSPSENQFLPKRAAFSRPALACKPARPRTAEPHPKQPGWRRSLSVTNVMLLSCALLAPAMPSQAKEKAKGGGGLKNAVVLIIRHAEKPDKGDGLSPAGQNRAAAYVGYFENFTVDSTPFKPDYLFAAADSKASRRPRLTLEPFSQAVGLPIDTRFPETKNKELVAAIRKKPPGKQYLLCWHHEEIPQLLSAFGANPGQLIGSSKWPDNVFDWVIQLRYDSHGRLTEARRINEGLMPGDSGK